MNKFEDLTYEYVAEIFLQCLWHSKTNMYIIGVPENYKTRKRISQLLKEQYPTNEELKGFVGTLFQRYQHKTLYEVFSIFYDFYSN